MLYVRRSVRRGVQVIHSAAARQEEKCMRVCAVMMVLWGELHVCLRGADAVLRRPPPSATQKNRVGKKGGFSPYQQQWAPGAREHVDLKEQQQPSVRVELMLVLIFLNIFCNLLFYILLYFTFLKRKATLIKRQYRKWSFEGKLSQIKCGFIDEFKESEPVLGWRQTVCLYVMLAPPSDAFLHCMCHRRQPGNWVCLLCKIHINTSLCS